MRAIVRILTGVAGLLAACALCVAQAPTSEAQATAPAQAVEAPKGELKPELVSRWKNMPPEERARMRERFHRWRDMTPEERQKVQANLERFRKLTPEQREKLIEARKKWDKVSPEMRQKMHHQFERFKELPPEVRQKVMQHMTFAREQLKGEFEALKGLPEAQREVQMKDMRRKFRALMQLKGEELEAFKKMTREEQGAKLKELMDKLPAEQGAGHEQREQHERHHRTGENGKTEAPAAKPEPAAAN
jgi:hypothetical protein